SIPTPRSIHTPFPYTTLFRSPSNESSNLVRLIAELMLGMEMFIRILFCRYDAIVITSPPFFAALFGTLASRLGGIPYVFDVRDEDRKSTRLNSSHVKISYAVF